MLKGRHLVAGEWLAGKLTFGNEPVSGPIDRFSEGDAYLVNAACEAAEEAFQSYSCMAGAARAQFLRRIAEEIEFRGDAITEQGVKETGLPATRLSGERDRTTAQLRLFADLIESVEYLDLRHDIGIPTDGSSRPDIRLMQRPVGPVAVFGASNFPLAFSTAGGDSASALAAGCPIVVKGHPAHPGVSDLVAQAIDAAITAQGIHPGVFNLIHGSTRLVGEELVTHPAIEAVGFTGSLSGGRSLFGLCASRAKPIPFYGEMGSINPIFLLPGAMAKRRETIAQGWAESLTLGAGQFCTNPGVMVVLSGAEVQSFVDSVVSSLAAVPPQIMLSQNIAQAFDIGRSRVASVAGVESVLNNEVYDRNVLPSLFLTSASVWLANDQLAEEVFGPLGMVVVAQDMSEVMGLARSLAGQLTCTIHFAPEDSGFAKSLFPILERKAGRLLANGFPTGVEVCASMVHGGPYPATTHAGVTSVGTMSIRRFLRPVSYQNIPEALLPDELTQN